MKFLYNYIATGNIPPIALVYSGHSSFVISKSKAEIPNIETDILTKVSHVSPYSLQENSLILLVTDDTCFPHFFYNTQILPSLCYKLEGCG
jgi:hypothetical protein